MEHQFNTEVAKDFDIMVATLLQNLKFWTLNNLANKRNIHDGLCWTYNTVEAYGLLFPYWTRHQIEHLLKKCEKEGLIQVGNYNATKYDRTKWYALTPKSYQYFPELLKEHFVDLLYSTISENSEINLGDFRNQFLNFPRPIPDSNPDIKPHTVKKSKSATYIPEYQVLKDHKIKCPKKPSNKVIELLFNAIAQLKQQEVTLDFYLNYLKTECSDWLYIPWGDRQRTNDEIAIILKPAIINDALAGKYEDKKQCR